MNTQNYQISPCMKTESVNDKHMIPVLTNNVVESTRDEM